MQVACTINYDRKCLWKKWEKFRIVKTLPKDQTNCEQIMNRKLSSWIPTAIFWILFAASIGFAGHYPWLDTVWYGALVIVLLGLSAYSLVYKVRHRREIGSLSYHGFPGWLSRFFFDEKDDSAGH